MKNLGPIKKSAYTVFAGVTCMMWFSFTAMAETYAVVEKDFLTHLAMSFGASDWPKKESLPYVAHDSEYIIFQPEVTRRKNKGLSIAIPVEYVTKVFKLHGGGNDEALVTMDWNENGQLSQLTVSIKWKLKTRYYKQWSLSGTTPEEVIHSFLKDSEDVFNSLVHVNKKDGRYYLREVLVKLIRALNDQVSLKKKVKDPKWVIRET